MNNSFPGAGSEAADHSAARRSPGHGRAAGGSAVSRAFTLMELLIVVAVIVVLVGILIPTLGKARDHARASQTQSLLSNLASDIDAYFLRFRAYPGPMDAAFTTANAVDNKLSGAQNMLIGLSYSILSSGSSITAKIPGGAPSFNYVKPSAPSGPTDFASLKPDGSPEQLSPFFTPTSKQIFDFYPTNNFANNKFSFPVVVDPFPDGLPILYYRRTVGVETAAKTGVANPASPGGYYFDENSEYTNPTSINHSLISTSGVAYPQNINGTTFGPTELSKLASNDGGNHVRGGYVLISAGIDRFYGTKNNKSDDLVLVGGE